MNKANNINRVTPTLTLTDVYHVPRGMQKFTNAKGELKHVGVCVQVWKHTGLPSFSATLDLPQNPEFIIHCRIHNYPLNHFDFYIKTLGSLKQVGKIVTEYPYSSSDCVVNKTTSWVGVKIICLNTNVCSRFKSMYESGDYVTKLQNTSSGNYYQINHKELKQMFYQTSPKPNFNIIPAVSTR
tara:strand:- start:1239 stop:1787 length:549 start_codon:yes stop_codon:yes gene_type:complete